MNRTVLTALLVKHEGWSKRPYTDTHGKLTIGVGRNLSDRGLLPCEIVYLLDNDINACIKDCNSRIASFGSLDDMRQHVLLDMCFNLGIGELMHFSKALAALEAHKWDVVAKEMLDSAWAKQVPERAAELARMMAKGKT